MIIGNVELLRYKDNFICRVTFREGAPGLSVSNNMQMVHLYPIFVNRIQPFFIGKNAVEMEKLLDEVYVHMNNYKLQSLAFWVPLATLEFAILDLLGKISGKSLGALIGDIHHKEISVYRANNFRGKSAEESVDLIRQQVEETNAKALKFKVGGRMAPVEMTASHVDERGVSGRRKTRAQRARFPPPAHPPLKPTEALSSRPFSEKNIQPGEGRGR